MHRPLTSVAAIAVAAVCLVSGCGSGANTSGKTTITKNTDPRTEFLTALSNTAHTNVLTATLKIDTTAAALEAFANKTSTDGDKLSAKYAQEIVNGQLVIESKSADGKQLTSALPGTGARINSDITFVEGGKTDAEIRTVSSTIYMKADLKSILALANKTNVYGNIVAETSHLPKFVQDLVAGKFVSIDTATLKTLAAELGGAGGVTTPTATQISQFETTLKADITRDVTVTKVGSGSGGDHLALTGQSRTLVHDLLTAVTQIEPQLAKKFNVDTTSDKVPAHSIVLDAYVSNNTVTKMSLDLTQFAKPSQVPTGVKVPLVLTLQQSGNDISKPASATPVDVSQLFSIFSALGGK